MSMLNYIERNVSPKPPYILNNFAQLSHNVLGNWRFFESDKENTKYFTGTKNAVAAC
jgi:hypothetical protein